MVDLLAPYRDDDKDLLAKYRDDSFQVPASQPNKPSLAQDLGNLALQGISNVGGAIGYGLEKTIAPNLGRKLQESDAANVSRLQSRLSPEQQQAGAQPLLNPNYQPGTEGGSSFLNPNFGLRSLAANVIPSIPGTLAMGVAGAPLARAATGAAKFLGAGKYASTIGSGLGYGASEGAFSGAQNAAQFGQEQRAKPIEAFQQSPEFQTELANLGDPEKAKEAVIQKGQNDIFNETLLKTGGISALTGGGVFGALERPAKTFVGGLAKGVVSEAAQEAPQSFYEQVAQNKATQKYVDPNQDIYESAKEAAAIGGLSGGIMGLAGGAGPLTRAANKVITPAQTTGEENERSTIIPKTTGTESSGLAESSNKKSKFTQEQFDAAYAEDQGQNIQGQTQAVSQIVTPEDGQRKNEFSTTGNRTAFGEKGFVDIEEESRKRQEDVIRQAVQDEINSNPKAKPKTVIDNVTEQVAEEEKSNAAINSITDYINTRKAALDQGLFDDKQSNIVKNRIAILSAIEPEQTEKASQALQKSLDVERKYNIVVPKTQQKQPLLTTEEIENETNANERNANEEESRKRQEETLLTPTHRLLTEEELKSYKEQLPTQEARLPTAKLELNGEQLFQEGTDEKEKTKAQDTRTTEREQLLGVDTGERPVRNENTGAERVPDRVSADQQRQEQSDLSGAVRGEDELIKNDNSIQAQEESLAKKQDVQIPISQDRADSFAQEKLRQDEISSKDLAQQARNEQIQDESSFPEDELNDNSERPGGRLSKDVQTNKRIGSREQEIDGGEQQSENPFVGAKPEDENKYFGTTVNLTAKDRKRADKGLVREGNAVVHSVKNNGDILEVKFPGDDFTTRVSLSNTYNVAVLDDEIYKKKSPTEYSESATTDERNTTFRPENTGQKNEVNGTGERPELGKFESPDKSFIATADGQKYLSSRGQRVGLLQQLNDKSGNPYRRDDLHNINDNNINAVQEYLIKRYNEINKSNKPFEKTQPEQQVADQDTAGIIAPEEKEKLVGKNFKDLRGDNERNIAIESDRAKDAVYAIQDERAYIKAVQEAKNKIQMETSKENTGNNIFLEKDKKKTELEKDADLSQDKNTKPYTLTSGRNKFSKKEVESLFNNPAKPNVTRETYNVEEIVDGKNKGKFQLVPRETVNKNDRTTTESRNDSNIPNSSEIYEGVYNKGFVEKPNKNERERPDRLSEFDKSTNKGNGTPGEGEGKLQGVDRILPETDRLNQVRWNGQELLPREPTLQGRDNRVRIGTSSGQNKLTGNDTQFKEALNPILSQTKSQYVKEQAKAQNLKVSSPGFTQAKAKIENQYEEALDKALAESSFNTFSNHPVNKDIKKSPSLLLSTYNDLRERQGLNTFESVDDANAKQSIDKLAHEAATSPLNDLAQPTQAQKDAGNYKKGHLNYGGFDIAIENPAGSKRTGVDQSGKTWSVDMKNHYGYIKQSKGADGDQVDVFLADNHQSDKVYVVNQNDPKTGKFDEHKVVLGANSLDEAKATYQQNYSKDWKGMGDVVEMSKDEFQSKLDKGQFNKPIKQSDVINYSDNSLTKIIDSNGNPEIMYHGGTIDDVSKFSDDKTAGWGFHFTKSKDEADSYAKNKTPSYVHPVVLNIQNPADGDAWKKSLDLAKGGNPRKQAVDSLKSQGFDGVRTDYETIAFYPEQIKKYSAIDEVKENRNPVQVSSPTPVKSTKITTRTLSGDKTINAKLYELPGYNGPQLAVQTYKHPSFKTQAYRVYLPKSGTMLEDSNGVSDLESTLKLAVKRVYSYRNKSIQDTITPQIKSKILGEGVPLFSQSKKSTGATKEQVHSWLDAKDKEHVKTGKLNIAETKADIPKGLVSVDANGVEGFYDPKGKKVWVVAENVNKDTVRSVLNHEYLHASLNENPRLNERLMKAHSDMRTLFNDVEKGAYTGKYKEVYDAALRRVDRAKTRQEDRYEEFLAYAITEHSKSPRSLPEKIAKAVQNIIASIKSAIFKYSGYIGKISPADLTALARSSMSSKGMLDNSGKDNPLASINAWHGSPHDHNKFDSANIGTGEGAQAYGYGHYFTDKKDIAEYYKNSITKNDDITITGKFDKSFFDDFDSPINDVKSSISNLFRNEASKPGYLKEIADNESYLGRLASGILNKTIIKNQGRIYQVELAPNENELLDWDKPLNYQSDKIKSFIEKIGYLTPWDGNENKITGWKIAPDISSRSVDILSPKGERVRTLQNTKVPGNLFEKVLVKEAKEIADKMFNPNGMSLGRDIYNLFSKTKGGDKKASDYLHSIGIRGIKYKADAGQSDAYNYVIFSDDDINITNKYSIKDDVKDFLTQSSNVISLADMDTVLKTGKMPRTQYDYQQFKDKAATLLVDSTRPFDVDMRKFPNVNDVAKVINAKDLAKGKTSALEKEAMRDFVQPLAEKIKALTKTTGFEFRAVQQIIGEWASARYAIEKNGDYIRQDQKAVDEAQKALDVDPTNSQLKSALTRAKTNQQKRLDAINEQKWIDAKVDGLSAPLAGGYNNFTAKEQMRKYEELIPRKDLEAAAKHIYDLMQWKVALDLKTGKVTQEQVDKWFKSPYYVPLTGDPSVDESEDELFQHGGVNQASDKAAKGRQKSKAQSGIDAAIEQVQKSTRYAGWNDFKDALNDLYNNLIQEELDNGATMREAIINVREKYNIVKKPISNDAMLPSTAITYRKGGKNYYFDLGNQAAIDALKSINKEQIPSILQPFANVTRLSARMVTTQLPGFAQVNVIRDVWERSENIRTRILDDYPDIDMNKVGKDAVNIAFSALSPTNNLVKKMASVMLEGTKGGEYIKVDNNDPDVQLIREMLATGAGATWGDYFENTNKTLANQLQKSTKLTSKAIEYVNAYNNSFELISSFAVYKALKQNGVKDSNTAGAATLNLMNFNKSGTATGPLRALYMFVNPAMQGAQQMAMTFSTNRGKARAAAYLIGGMALYTALRAIGGDDDDLGVNKMDAQSSFVTERNISIPIGNDEFIKVPVGFGMPQLMWSTATNLVKAMAGSQDAADTAAEIVKSFMRVIAPVAPSETAITDHPIFWMAQSATPQIAKPITNIALGINAFGQPLTNSKFENPSVSRALQGRKSTPEEYKEMAQVLGRMGIKMYPEEVRELVNGYGLGPIREYIIKPLIENPNKEKLGRKTISTTVDRWVSAYDKSGLKERLYYRMVDEANDASIKKSLGSELSPREQKLANLNDVVTKLNRKASGKLAAATKAEKAKKNGAKYRREGEQIKDNAMNIMINGYKNLPD